MALRDTAPLLVGLLLFFHTLGVWATVVVNMEDKVEVLAEETARITCMFTTDEGPGGTTIQWFYVPRFGEKQRIYNKEPMQEAVETSTPFKDRISLNVNGTTAVLIIREVGVKDEVEFICVIKTLTDGTGEGRTKLKVFVLPDLPSIDGVQTGISVNEEEPSKIGSCEVKNGYPKPNITWYRNDTPLRNTPNELDMLTTVTTESSGLFSLTSELKMKVKKEDKDAKFYCEVVYFVPGATRMTESRRINITVYYRPTAVDIWVESPKGKIKEGDTLELRCKDNGNYPSSITTIKRSEQDFVEDTIMKRSNVTRSDGGVYKCVFVDTDTFEEISGSTEVFVNYLDPAVITPKDSVVVMEGEELKASCNALSSLRTAITWFKNEKVVSKNNILVMKNATFDTAGMYMCVVTVPEIEGMKTSGTLRVNVNGPPKIVGPDIQEVETYESSVNLSCSFRGFPVPTIIWSTADGKILKALQTMTEDATQSVVTVNVISSVTAFCNASNDLGTKVAVFNIKAIINTTLTTTITITPSTNTTFLNDTVINTTLTTITITPSTNTTFLNDTVINTTLTTITITPSTNTTFLNDTVINTTSSSITPANITTTPSSNTTFFNDTVTHTTSATKTTLSNDTVKTPTKSPNIKKESKGFVIAVIIICILLLAVLGSVLYFLYKKGRICGRSGKQDLTKGKSSKDNIVVEMKSDNTEEAVLLGVNGEKQPPNDQ